MATSDTERLAIVETDVNHIKEDLVEIKAEVHEINLYLRKELENKIKNKEMELYMRSKLQIYSATVISFVALAITVIHYVVF
jgi:hypothetical protein